MGLIGEMCMKTILQCGTTSLGGYLRWIVVWISSPRQSTYSGTVRQGNHFCLVGGRWQSPHIRHELGNIFHIHIIHQSRCQSRSQNRNYTLGVVLIIQIWGAMTISQAPQATDIIRSLISSAHYHLSTPVIPAHIYLNTPACVHHCTPLL